MLRCLAPTTWIVQFYIITNCITFLKHLLSGRVVSNTTKQTTYQTSPITTVTMATHPDRPPLHSFCPDNVDSKLGGVGSDNLYLKFSKLPVFNLSSVNNTFFLSNSAISDIHPGNTDQQGFPNRTKESDTELSQPQHEIINDIGVSSEQIQKLPGNQSDSASLGLEYNENTLQLFQTLDKIGIKHETFLYRPKSGRIKADSNLVYCKNLFLKDRKGRFYLVTCPEDTDVDLKQLRKDVKAYRNFSFGTPGDLEAILKTQPGGVTPFSLMFETAAEVAMVISNTIANSERELMFHPLDPNLATKVSFSNLLRFLKHTGHSIQFLD